MQKRVWLWASFVPPPLGSESLVISNLPGNQESLTYGVLVRVPSPPIHSTEIFLFHFWPLEKLHRITGLHRTLACPENSKCILPVGRDGRSIVGVHATAFSYNLPSIGLFLSIMNS